MLAPLIFGIRIVMDYWIKYMLQTYNMMHVSRIMSSLFMMWCTKWAKLTHQTSIKSIQHNPLKKNPATKTPIIFIKVIITFVFALCWRAQPCKKWIAGKALHSSGRRIVIIPPPMSSSSSLSETNFSPSFFWIRNISWQNVHQEPVC